ncbi:MAG: lamin tail domain-containing protein, partial [Bacteroidales bacterium]|nr:lamin tail domain-containing protein [Bacteroidales bacterium]
YSNQLEEIKNYLDSSSRVDTIINRIYAEGLFILSGDNDGDVTTIILGVYNTGFTIFRPLLKAALSIVIPGFLDTIISLLDTATEIDDLVNEFSTEIVSKIKEVTEPLPLPDELTPETIAQIVKENLLTGELKELLGLLLGIATTKAEAQRNQAEKLLEKAEKEELGRINRVHHEEAISSVEKIEIISPENIEQQGSHKYALGPKVDVELFLKGATISRVEEGSLQRVFISVNGKRINYRYSDWHIDSNGIRYMQTLDLLSSVIHAGINVFECSIIHEGTVKKRASSTFIVDPNAPPLNSIAVDIIASQFNVPNKNDHRNTEEEYVSFINNGLEEVDIEGWVLSDAKKHIYILPAEIIKPGETFKVVTGEGVNTNRIFYIGRHAAIWNNPGDLVRLIDKNTNLRTLYSYPIE